MQFSGEEHVPAGSGEIALAANLEGIA
jgi:hypothetical protein